MGFLSFFNPFHLPNERPSQMERKEHKRKMEQGKLQQKHSEQKIE